ncbi:hypothetical protein B0H34DRAFT_725801 [Crassisporium funariophilum]|nr:hypothetical protein B0H34DRAFT_725801 [Crassisporium funariophilum]
MCSALGEAFRVYLESKSTSMGLGGYQGLEEIRSFCEPVGQSMRILSPSRFLKHPFHWVDYVLPGPHDDEKYISTAVPADLTQRAATDSKSVSNCRARRIILNGRGRAAGRVGRIRVIF